MSQQLVVLDNAVLMSLLQRPEVVQAFPFLKAMADKVASAPKTRCAPCARKNRANALDLEGIKTAIGSLGSSQKLQLKGFLNASQVRLVYRNYRNQVVKETF